MLENLPFFLILTIPTILLKYTNIKNWLVTNQYLYILILKTKMYDCGYCLQFWITFFLFIFYNLILFLCKL